MSVELCALRKSFGDVLAVDDVNVSLKTGESLVVLGPSGSGKSTLLRIVAGLEHADSGEILIGGRPQAHLPPHERDVAIVFQHFALYPHLDALHNITLGLRHGLGLSRTEANARAHQVATILEIDHLLTRRPRAMSGGQRQRVALGRALARRASVVLLDEPLSGLDAQLRLSLRAEISRVLRSTGATHVHVTHDQNDAMAMADRVAVINEGRIEQLDTPQRLYDSPQSLFVAGFVGSPPMNLLACDNAGDRIRTPFGPLPRGGHARLTLGVRPERIAVTGPEQHRWDTPGRIVLLEPEGASTIVYVEAGRFTVKIRVPSGYRPEIGDRVPLFTDPRDVLVFDPESGLLLAGLPDFVGAPSSRV